MDYDNQKPFTPIGKTNFRNSNQLFGIKLKDRFNHIYKLGKTGSGKTSLLLNMAIDDMQKGYGLALIEPHGDACLELLSHVPERRKYDVIYFDATDHTHRIGFNPLHNVPTEERHLVASEIVLAFKKIWGDSWGPRMEYILRFCILTLLDYPHATLLDIQPLLLDQSFRSQVLHYVKNMAVRQFWYNEFDKYPAALKAESIMPILNKAGVFQANAVLRDIVGQVGGISIAEVMDSGKILICNLSKGIIGEDASQILGSLLTTAIQTAAMRRAAIAEHERKPFMVFIDECHTFITTSFATMLSEIRKFKVGLLLTNQYLGQLPDDVRNSIFGNVGTLISFRVGIEDAKMLADEFYPVFTADDCINLPRYAIYLKLLIDGMASKSFSAETLPLPVGNNCMKDFIIAHGREQRLIQVSGSEPLPRSKAIPFVDTGFPTLF